MLGGVVTTLHDRVVHHASKLTAADLGKGNTLFPIDDIAHGAVSPLLASDVKRVLEHVADAHRNRHRRRESAESGSVGRYVLRVSQIQPPCLPMQD